MKINVYIYKNDNSIGVEKDKSDILRSYDFFGRMGIYRSCGFEYIGTYQIKGGYDDKLRDRKNPSGELSPETI